MNDKLSLKGPASFSQAEKGYEDTELEIRETYRLTGCKPENPNAVYTRGAVIVRLLSLDGTTATVEHTGTRAMQNNGSFKVEASRLQTWH